MDTKLNRKDPFAVAAWEVLVDTPSQSPELLANAIAVEIRDGLKLGTITGETLWHLLPEAAVEVVANRAELVIYTGWSYDEYGPTFPVVPMDDHED